MQPNLAYMICPKCRVAYRCKQNEVPVKDPEAGGFESTYWLGDLYECPDCGAQVIKGFGGGVVKSEEPDSVAYMEREQPALEFRYEGDASEEKP